MNRFKKNIIYKPVVIAFAIFFAVLILFIVFDAIDDYRQKKNITIDKEKQSELEKEEQEKNKKQRRKRRIVHSCVVKIFHLNLCFQSRFITKDNCKKLGTKFFIDKPCDVKSAHSLCRNVNLSSKIKNLDHNVDLFLYKKNDKINQSKCESPEFSGRWIPLKKG